MPIPLTYPGVYIEEIPSGVRTISGVATSITAFIGRAPRGPVDRPITINNFGDFDRAFGGLQLGFPMGYAVRQFYQNSGSRALIVRVWVAPDPTPAGVNPDGVATGAAGGLDLVASSPGEWGNRLTAGVTRDGLADTSDTGPQFNLTVQLDPENNGPQETFLALSVDPQATRRVDRILAQSSQYVRAPNLPANPPTNAPIDPDNPTLFTGAGDSGPLESAGYIGDDPAAKLAAKEGLFALERADLFNLLCIPPDTLAGDTPIGVYQEALTYCVSRHAMLLVDPLAAWDDDTDITDNNNQALTDLGLTGPEARNAALFFPRVVATNPLRGEQLETFVPCGMIAGVMARTDSARGVWKAPAGIDATLSGTRGLTVDLTDDENGNLNPLGVNCLRTFPIIGRVVWGSRTMRGADVLADEYRYVPVRRLALFLEESLYRGTQWVVFEPNDEPLWAQIRLNIGAFMQNLFRQGAFQGRTPQEAYFVRCDRETTTQNDINLGIVNIIVGFAPLRPAEFVVIQLQQMAGQVQT